LFRRAVSLEKREGDAGDDGVFSIAVHWVWMYDGENDVL
jgi:hypothetical protein